MAEVLGSSPGVGIGRSLGKGQGHGPLESSKDWSPENAGKGVQDETDVEGRAQQATAGNLARIQLQWAVCAVIRLGMLERAAWPLCGDWTCGLRPAGAQSAGTAVPLERVISGR